MIEVMVAILIFSFGMLGLAALQGAALRYQKSAWNRAAVSGMTSDLAERIRSNRDAAAAGGYTFTTAYSTTAYTDSTTCSATSSGATLAKCDVTALVQTAQAQLPGGWINLSGSPATGYLATVMWADATYLDTDGSTLLTSPVCATTSTALQQRSCCPASASAPAGVRCVTTQFLP